MDFSKQLTKSTRQVLKTYIKREKTLFFKETRYTQNIFKIFLKLYILSKPKLSFSTTFCLTDSDQQAVVKVFYV